MIAHPGRYLISLDLDGTSVRYEPRLEIDPMITGFIKDVRSRGVVWVMNSDRFTDTMIDLSAQLEDNIRPAGILSCQRFIHFLNGDGSYVPLESWNKRQLERHRLLWCDIEPYFDSWQKHIERNYTVVQSVANETVFACMVPQHETPKLRREMKQFIRPWPDAGLSGNQDWTFILHSSFSKGNVLKKFADVSGIEYRDIIAVGDGINDISMLDGSVTPHVGCPANASQDVADAVLNAGGIVGERESAEGTLEVLNYYRDTVMR